MMTSGEVLRILNLFDTVEWGRFSVGRHPLDGLYQPPMMAWRFSSPEAWVGGAIAAAVQSMNDPVKWRGDFTKNNWSVMPERLHEGFRAHATESHIGVMTDLKVTDQGFCELANLDFERLMHKLERVALSSSSDPWEEL
jgi:hypothetical protein